MSLEHAEPIKQRHADAEKDAPTYVDPLKRYLSYEKAFLAGELDGVQGPVSGVATEPFYFDVRCEGPSDLRLPAPPGHNVFAYPYVGNIRVGAEEVALVHRGNIALLGPGASVSVACDEAASFILVGGKPLNEPIARYGPFVMNTADEIRQAIMDFQAGRF